MVKRDFTQEINITLDELIDEFKELDIFKQEEFFTRVAFDVRYKWFHLSDKQIGVLNNSLFGKYMIKAINEYVKEISKEF